MIPSHIDLQKKVKNIPRTGYTLKEKDGRVSVYLDKLYVRDISLDNFFYLFKEISFSKGRVNSNLLVFIEYEARYYLVPKNSKKYKDALMRYSKLSDISPFVQIKFISSNESFEGIYLGKGTYSLHYDNIEDRLSEKESVFIYLGDKKLLVTRDISKIEIVKENTIPFNKEYDDFKIKVSEFGYISKSSEAFFYNIKSLDNLVSKQIGRLTKKFVFHKKSPYPERIFKLNIGDVIFMNETNYIYLGVELYYGVRHYTFIKNNLISNKFLYLKNSKTVTVIGESNIDKNILDYVLRRENV